MDGALPCDFAYTVLNFPVSHYFLSRNFLVILIEDIFIISEEKKKVNFTLQNHGG